MFKKLKEKLLINLIVLVLKAYSKTLRFSLQGLENVDLETPCIFIFWHNRQIFMPFFWKKIKKWHNSKAKFTMLISKHQDGRIAAKVVKKLGVHSVAGSSSKGATSAALALSNAIKNGSHIGITPDGPKGPIYKMKKGPVKIHQITGAPVHTLSVNPTSFWSFEKSWDKMMLPKPFSKVNCVVGEKIEIADVNHYEEILNKNSDVN